MTRPLPRLLLGVLATVASIPGAALAQSATPPRPTTDAPADTLTAQERDALTSAEQLAAETQQVLEQWITTQAITEDRLFARVYFPIAKTAPMKFSTPYDALADRDVVGIEDKVLTHSSAFQYAILTDINGYAPSYNTRFAQALTGNLAQDYVNNRSKRLLPDLASLTAARSEVHYLLQRTKLETGDVIYDVSVPIMVRGKHWGCARIGYRRTD